MEISAVKTWTFLLAWLTVEQGNSTLFFENSTARMFREQGITSAGVIRDGHKVTVFCDHIHGDDYLKEDELRLVAMSYLDGTYKTTDINLRR